MGVSAQITIGRVSKMTRANDGKMAELTVEEVVRGVVSSEAGRVGSGVADLVLID